LHLGQVWLVEEIAREAHSSLHLSWADAPWGVRLGHVTIASSS
jgi:hypothetical protein